MNGQAIERRVEIAQRPADHRPKAVWIDVTNLLRDGVATASSSWAPAFAGELP